MILLIRADAGAVVGTGHVMRCLALTQAAVARGWIVVFALAEKTEAIARRIEQAGHRIVALSVARGSRDDATQTRALAGEINATWIIADGYCFGAEWQREIKRSSARVLMLDDYGHAASYAVDIVLNPNYGADFTLYQKRAPSTRLLLGLDFLLVRPEFRTRMRRVHASVGKRVLVSMGGSDPANATRLVIEGLATVPGLEVLVVIGGSNPQAAELEQLALRSGWQAVIDASNMAGLMHWADLGVLAAGSTLWEAGCTHLPCIIVICAANQRVSAQNVAQAGAAISLGAMEELTPADVAKAVAGLATDGRRRQAIAEKLGGMVNADGVDRVLAALEATESNLSALHG